jgi:hypothetical protein
MVIDQGSLSYNISDSVYFYKATPDLTYKVGAQEYWDFSDRSDREREQLRVEADSSEEEEVQKDPVKVKKQYPRKKNATVAHGSDDDTDDRHDPRRQFSQYQGTHKRRYKDAYRDMRRYREQYE